MRISVIDPAPQTGFSQVGPAGKWISAWRQAAPEFRKTPNQITLARFAATIALYGLVNGDRIWFVAVYLFAWLTDVLDGYLARRLQQMSRFGMQLDTAADYFLIVSGLWWLTKLSPDSYHGHGVFWCTVVASVAIPQLVALAKLRGPAGFHLWSDKITGGIANATFLSRIVNGVYPLPVALLATCCVLEGIEQIAVCLLVSDPYAHPRPTIFHYLRAKRNAGNPG